MFENSRRGRQARNFTTNVPKTLDLKSSSEQIDVFRKLTLGAPIQTSTDSADCTPAVVVFEVPSVLDVDS